MDNFADQCLDMAQSILGHNLEAIGEQGTVSPAANETTRFDEPGHAALAIGEYYRATSETKLGDADLLDLAARCITAQAFTDETYENGLAYAALGLLSFGPAKDRNAVWERLLDPTREQLDARLLERTDYENHFQVFNIAKAVTRYSLGLSKKDETGRLIERFLERIDARSANGYFDDSAGAGERRLGGAFDIYGVLCFVFIRQALQLHGNLNLRDRKLPSLRTYSEKYLKLIPDLTRMDGLGWAYGRSIGAYGQMHCISLTLQALRDGWISEEQRDLYADTVRRLFKNLFATYLDQEHGYLVIRDAERDTVPYHTTRMANFDAARYLCQWSRLARSVGGSAAPAKPVPSRKVGRYVSFDKSHRKEQGLFLYQDAESGLALQLPLITAPGGGDTCDHFAFPHAPGIFDWPVGRYLPVMLPELTFGEKVILPAFYGKNCTTSIGLRNALVFKYEQPELITRDQIMANGLGGCKVTWSFLKQKITCEFAFSVKQQIQLDRMRYVLAIGAPHSRYRVGTALRLGPEGHRTNVVKDDFQAEWNELETVGDDPGYRTAYGNLHYLQILERKHPLIMRPGQQYRLSLSFEPDLAFADE